MKRISALMILVCVATMTWPVQAHTQDDPFEAILYAGQTENVGKVLVWNDADKVYVKYCLEDPTPDPLNNWYLTGIHLQIATDPDLIIQKNGNPVPGLFDIKRTYDPPQVCSEVFEVELSEVLGAELPEDVGVDSVLSIAAHADVKLPGGVADLPLVLPDTVTISVKYPYGGGPAYFPHVYITGEPLSNSEPGDYLGWCVDTDHVIYENKTYTAKVLSSYSDEDLTNLVEFPENLDLVNWILNQGYVGQSSPGGYGVYTYGDVQVAIWSLVEDNVLPNSLGPWSQDRVNEILAAATASGEGFIPQCGQIVAVLLAPIDGTTVAQVIIAQVILAEIPIPCEAQEETAWGDGPEFPGKNWATYIEYTVQGEIPVEWPEGGTTTVAFEDLPIAGGNDWDYNDWVADIQVKAIYFGTSADKDLTSMEFSIDPQVKLAGYTHVMHLDTSAFDCTGTFELWRDGKLVKSGSYTATSGIDVVLVPNTGSPPDEVKLIITFDAGCEFDFSAFDPYAEDSYHGEKLFFDPYLVVNNTGEIIGQGDARMLTVPTDWAWPTPDGTPIWSVYSKVIAGNPPTFVPYWWEP